jgi:hypothetical protein
MTHGESEILLLCLGFCGGLLVARVIYLGWALKRYLKYEADRRLEEAISLDRNST